MTIVESRQHWIIEPRHGFFAKDGRGWYAGSLNEAKSLGWILPTTLRGALCSAIGREREITDNNVLRSEEWLELKQQLQIVNSVAVRIPLGNNFRVAHRMWPAPADAVHFESSKSPSRLVAREPSVSLRDGNTQSSAEVSSLRLMMFGENETDVETKPATGPLWWNEHEFIHWLCGDPSKGPTTDLSSSRQPQLRTDVHIKMDSDRQTAETGSLWSHEFQETVTLDDNGSQLFCWGFGITFDFKNPKQDELTPKTALLAGDRQIASVMKVDNLGNYPAELKKSAEQMRGIESLRIYAVTPSVFKNGWYPDNFELQAGRLVGMVPGIDHPVSLVAASVRRPLPISGWDMVGKTERGGTARETRLACPPGSMWMIQRADGELFTPEDVQNLWLSCWGRGQEDGLGCIVAGLDSNSMN